MVLITIWVTLADFLAVSLDLFLDWLSRLKMWLMRSHSLCFFYVCQLPRFSNGIYGDQQCPPIRAAGC